MVFELDILHHAGIVHEATDAFLYTPTTSERAESIDDHILIQCIVHRYNKPCLANPDAES